MEDCSVSLGRKTNKTNVRQSNGRDDHAQMALLPAISRIEYPVSHPFVAQYNAAWSPAIPLISLGPSSPGKHECMNTPWICPCASSCPFLCSELGRFARVGLQQAGHSGHGDIEGKGPNRPSYGAEGQAMERSRNKQRVHEFASELCLRRTAAQPKGGRSHV